MNLFLQLSQQLSGINAVFYYSTVILQAAGFDQETAEYANLSLGGTVILITIISIFLIDRLGRRPLHLIGLGGMFVTSLLLVISLLIQSSDVWNKISLVMTIILSYAILVMCMRSTPYLSSVYFFINLINSFCFRFWNEEKCQQKEYQQKSSKDQKCIFVQYTLKQTSEIQVKNIFFIYCEEWFEC